MATTQNNDAQRKGIQLLSFLDLLNNLTDRIWTSENYIVPRERFYYAMFMKLQFLLDGIQMQIYNLDNKPHYGLSAMLTLRTCMLDVLNIYYVMDVHDDDALCLLRVNAIMADHLKYVYNDLGKDQKAAVRKDWPELFEEDGRLLSFERVTPKDLVKNVNQYDTLKVEVKEAYHIYQLFSKLEHNGAFTFDILHNQYAPGGNDTRKFLIYHAIAICALACKLLSENWISSESDLARQMDHAIKDLLAIDGPKDKSNART